jgi:phosphate transport system permease protein
MNGDKIARFILLLSSVVIVMIASAMIYSLVSGAIPVLMRFGPGFITSSQWNPVTEEFGALPFIAGTLLTSFLSLIICLPLSFSASILLGEYLRGTKAASAISLMIDMLAGIPSIIYGLWGFYTLRPLIVQLGLSQQGYGIFTASVILSIMIIPYATSLGKEIIAMVPGHLKEAGYALGATRKEVIMKVILPGARSGIFAGYILAFGRALGETMAVTMLIGNANVLPGNLFSPGNTMASVIASQFGEASGLLLSALIAIGLILFLITAAVNYMGKMIINRFA